MYYDLYQTYTIKLKFDSRLFVSLTNMIGKLIWIVAIPIVSLGLQHIFMGNVTSVPMNQEEHNKETNNLTCKDILHMQHILVENVSIVPRTQGEYNEQTKDLKCNHPMLKITYVLNPGSNKTSIGCFCEKPVAVKKCLEYNKNNEGITIIQPKGDAPCHNLSITPCKVKYFSSESYKLFGCFEKYGGISPIENQRIINSLKQRELSLNTEIQELKKTLGQREISFTKKIQEQNQTIKQRDDKIQNLQDENDVLKIYNGIAIFVIVVFILLLVLLIAFILFHFRNCKSNRKAILNESHNSGTTLRTDNGDLATVPMMTYNDQQKKEHSDDDPPRLENTGVEVTTPRNGDQADDILVIQVGKPLEKDLKMNKRRNKESVVYPV